MIKSYLSNRYQCVKYKNTTSSSCKISIGVPQGSILGPLLFIIYINDFPKICPTTTSLLYADDTAIFFEGKSHIELQNAIDRELPRICNWFHANKLSLNASKTFCQLYSKSSNNISIKVKLDCTQVKFVESVKYLGIHIDTDMKWKTHIEGISNILSRNIGIVKKSSYYLDKKHLLLLYNALCLPYINYCCLIWGHSAPTILNRLFLLQKRVVRVIDGQHRLAHTNPIFAKLKILKVKDIAVQQSIIFIHKVMMRKVPENICSLFTVHQTPPRAMRNIKHFEEPFTRKLYGTRTISWLGPRLWNTLITPVFPEINNIPESKLTVKRTIKEKILVTYNEQ